MTAYRISREDVKNSLTNALKPLDYVHAFWEGGAAGFGRVDQWSDLDLQMIVEEEKIEEAFEVIESTLNTLSAIEVKFRIPEPTWHGHSQCLYRLNDASPFLMIDVAIMKENTEADRFMETRIHGVHQVVFDKTGTVKDKPVDIDSHLDKIKARLESLTAMFDLFWILAPKEINRGNSIEAISFYAGYTLRPLVELLRIKHCPMRFFYGTRYVHYDLPPEVIARLEKLYFPQDLETLSAYREEAESWFWEVYEEIDLGEVREKLLGDNQT